MTVPKDHRVPVTDLRSLNRAASPWGSSIFLIDSGSATEIAADWFARPELNLHIGSDQRSFMAGVVGAAAPARTIG